MRIGMVVPVRNEAVGLPALLSSVSSQTGLESLCTLAVVDGMSEDLSLAVVADWRQRLPMLVCLRNPARVTSAGFNIGIRACLAANADTVVLVGAHSVLGVDFLHQLEASLRDQDADIIGAVHDYPLPASRLEAAIQAFSESFLGRRLARFTRLGSKQVTDVAFSPAIRRRVFEAIGLFDEELVRNQDNDFTMRARRAGFAVLTDPRLRYLYRTRREWRSLLRQMKQNGYWVGRNLRAHSLRHFAPALFWCTLPLFCLASWLLGLPWYAGLGVWALPYIAVTIGAAAAWVRRIGLAAFLLPPLYWFGHASYAWGTTMGLLRASRGGRRG